MNNRSKAYFNRKRIKKEFGSMYWSVGSNSIDKLLKPEFLEKTSNAFKKTMHMIKELKPTETTLAKNSDPVFQSTEMKDPTMHQISGIFKESIAKKIEELIYAKDQFYKEAGIPISIPDRKGSAKIIASYDPATGKTIFGCYSDDCGNARYIPEVHPLKQEENKTL